MTEEVQDSVRGDLPDETPDETRDETGAGTQDGTAEITRLELLRRIRVNARLDGNAVTLPRDVLADVLALALGDMVDEEWYRDRYTDMGEAVERGVLADAAAHYTMAGIYEGRMPYRVPLDNAAYLENHQDVLSSIREGAFRSALDHFVRVGFAEGRTFWLASREAPDP